MMVVGDGDELGALRGGLDSSVAQRKGRKMKIAARRALEWRLIKCGITDFWRYTMQKMERSMTAMGQDLDWAAGRSTTGKGWVVQDRWDSCSRVREC
jgi:hypothetical protein